MKKTAWVAAEKIIKSWNLQKGEGRNIAAAVLRAFIGRYGSNNDIKIDSKVIQLRDNAGQGHRRPVLQ